MLVMIDKIRCDKNPQVLVAEYKIMFFSNSYYVPQTSQQGFHYMDTFRVPGDWRLLRYYLEYIAFLSQ